MYVVISVALAVLAAVAFTHIAERRYEARADLLVAPIPSGTLVGLPVLREQFTGRSVVTAARLANSPQVAFRARTSLGLAFTPSVTVTPQEQSNIVTITASSTSPDEAVKIANAFAQSLLAERTEQFQQALRQIVAGLSRRLRTASAGSVEAAALSNRLADFRSLSGDRDPTLEIVSRAVPASEPVWPRPRLSVAVAAVIGLLLGIAIAVGLDIANPIVMRAESIVEQGAPPILTRMPRLTDGEVRAALSRHEVPPEIRASVRTLWANLGSLPPDQSQAGTLLITSPGAGDGSPAVAAVLATLMARAGMNVMLIDADLERGSLTGVVDGKAASVASLGHVLASKDASVIQSSFQPLVASRLRVLLDDPEDRHLTKWMPPDRLSALVAHLKGQVEVDALVISAPPPPAAETTVLADLADAVIITVAVGRTRRDQLTRLRQGLAERGVVPAGFVVLERPSLLTRIAQVPSKPSARRRWS